MAVELIDLELIQDNPFQPRTVYHRQDINDLAASIKIYGLLQVPPARRKNGEVQLGFGHLRKRAFLKLAKQEPATWGKMPLDIRELTDEQMAMFSLEENLRRRDITPIEVARAVDNYLSQFSDKTEVEVARQLSMTQGNISNMRRVIKLPVKILEKVDQGRISFTQARELITMEKLEHSEELMLAAIRGIRTRDTGYGHENTVGGMQGSIHDVISGRCRPLDKAYEGYRHDLIFDTRAAGCLQCEKMVRTHPTKSATAHYCLDGECWDRHRDEQREKVSAEAKARMQADIIKRAVHEIAHGEETVERIISVDEGKFTEISASYSADRISKGEPLKKPFKWEEKLYIAIGGISAPGEQKEEAYQLVPRAEFAGEIKTYTVPKGREYEEYYESLRNDPMGFYHCILVKCGKEEYILVGPPITFVCKKDISQEIAEVTEAPAPSRIPEEVLALAREKAGTRAEVLDLKDIDEGYRGGVKKGYALLDGFDRALEHVIDPGECLERCTKGFHYAFNSRQDNPRTQYVCSDPKCLAGKKAAFTRAKNAEGQARKNAERKALKEAIAQTTNLDRPRLKLILLAQMDGGHTTRHYYGPTDGKKPETWLWEKLSAGTPAIKRERKDLFKRIDKLSDEELTKLIVECMLYYLTDKGDIGSYEIKTAEPLMWMGIEIKIENALKGPASKSEHEQIEDLLPCKDCQNAPTCDRTFFYADDEGDYGCDHKVTQEEVPDADR